MGIFDSLKKIVTNTASNVVDNALNQVKEEVTEKTKEKTQQAIMGGVKNYINNIEEKATTEESKEATRILKNMVDDTDNMRKSAMGEKNDGVDYETKIQADIMKLAELVDKQNNQN